MSEPPISYGTYLCATTAYADANTQASWQAGEIALVFSRAPRSGRAPTSFDLLFENGRTIFAADATVVKRHFRAVHADPDFVIDGCSTNPGWRLARQKADSAALPRASG